MLYPPHKIHHIGYAVKNIEEASKIFGMLSYEIKSSIIEDIERNVKILFVENNLTLIELIQTLDAEIKSPLDFLFKKKFSFPGNGIPYHICYSVNNIDKEIQNLNHKEHFILIQKKSKAPALGGRNVAFL